MYTSRIKGLRHRKCSSYADIADFVAGVGNWLDRDEFRLFITAEGALASDDCWMFTRLRAYTNRCLEDKGSMYRVVKSKPAHYLGSSIHVRRIGLEDLVKGV